MRTEAGLKPETDEQKRILIVDDEKDFVLSLIDILESYGYIVEKAHHEKEALERIQEFDAHVVLLDLRLGNGSGINLISRFKEIHPKILPVIMTAYAATDTAIEALQEGAYDYLRKPLNPRDLLATLDRCFEKIGLENDKSAAEEALLKRNRELEEINARLKESEERYRLLVETMHDGLSARDADGTMSYNNPAFCHMVGYQPEELLGRPIDIIFDEANRRIINEQMAKRKKGAPIQSYEVELTHKNGERISAILSPQDIFDAKGQYRGSFAVLTDITDIKQAEMALKESEGKFKGLFQLLSHPIALVQKRSRTHVDVNEAFCRMTRYTREEIIGRSTVELGLYSEEERDRVIQELRRVNVLNGFETVFKTKEGTFLDVLLFLREIELGGQEYILSTFIDITKRKGLEAQLQQSQKMEAIGTLAGGIAHDFNNSLQAILGYTQMLIMDKEEQDPERARLLRIEKAAQQARELTQQLLTFSRKVESQFRPVDLNQEIKQFVGLMKRTIPKMIDIHLHLEDHLEVINADPSQLEQILMNLAVNAKDAMGEEGRLTIETNNVSLGEDFCRTHVGAVPGTYVQLIFSDTGHGMEKETLEKIFEPFFTTKEIGKGTGLGLSMVYGLVQKHGGYITCDSGPGKGTTFKIYFPVVETISNNAGKRLETPESSIPTGKNETILLVDDEPLIRDLGEQILKRFGYHVLSVGSAERALDYCREIGRDISLVILDLIMPGMGGKHCLEEILGIDPDFKVVIASGYSSDGNVKAAQESGAKGFVKKPFNINQMLRVVREVLDAE